MNEVELLNTKLKPGEQWFCDGCGEIIESDKDGMLEWESIMSDDSKGFTAESFRIVHGNWMESCNKQRYDSVKLSDGHLHWFTGEDGLSRLLGFLFEQQIDPKELAIIIKRLQIKYYEEARTYIPLAHADDQHDIDPYDIGDINESDAIWLIRKYGRQ